MFVSLSSLRSHAPLQPFLFGPHLVQLSVSAQLKYKHGWGLKRLKAGAPCIAHKHSASLLVILPSL